MNRYQATVKYKAYAESEISLDAENEEEAVKIIFDVLDTSQVEEFEVLTVKLLGDAASFAPSTSTAQ